MRRIFLNAVLVAVLCGFSSLAPAQAGSIASRGVPASFLKKIRPRTAHAGDTAAVFGPNKRLTFGLGGNGPSGTATQGLPGVDSLVNFSDQFTTPGFDSNGNPQSVWPYTMVGTIPERNRSTEFDSPIVPVELDLLGPDGNVAVFNGQPLVFIDTPDIVGAVANSPVFEPYVYNSGIGQFNDQMMRTQFWNRIRHHGDGDDDSQRRHHGDGDDDSQGGYHNTLEPSVKTARRIQIPFSSNWFFVFDPATNQVLAALVDFNTFANLLFPTTVPVDNTTPIGAAELAGDITTRDISSFLFNNVYLYEGSINNCCVLGFHTYDFEPGDASNGNRERRFVVNYSSWVTNGLFFFGFEDVTPLSHEMSETFDDPFVNNATPWWLNVDPFTGGAICQNNLEVGDVIEVLTANDVYASAVDGRTYHPQNVALLPWFAFQSPSQALHGAYSFPDETTLPALSPGNLLPGCIPAP